VRAKQKGSSVCIVLLSGIYCESEGGGAHSKGDCVARSMPETRIHTYIHECSKHESHTIVYKDGPGELQTAPTAKNKCWLPLHRYRQLRHDYICETSFVCRMLRNVLLMHVKYCNPPLSQSVIQSSQPLTHARD
jgi:hypothetical protein